MTIPYRFAALASAFAFIPSYGFAEATRVPEIVVSSTRMPTPVSQIASSVTVITAEEIEQKNQPTVTALLRDVPGIAVAQSGNPTQPTSIFMRGTNSNHVLVMVDGITINDPADPTDAFDFSNLSTNNIERIEILRGPQSTLYGSQAIGGVINIITRQGKGKPQHNAFAEYGRYNSRRVGAGSSGEIGRTSYSIQGSNGHSSGFSTFHKRYGGYEKDGNDTYHVSANVASRLTDNFTAKLVSRYSRVDTEYDLFGVDTPVPTNDTRLISNGVSGELALFDRRWIQELTLSNALTNRSVNEDFFGYNHYWGGRDRASWLHHLTFIPSHVLTLGAEASHDYYKSDIQSQVSVNNNALFLNDQFTITDAFFMNAGVRLDDHETFGHATTWKIAPGYRIKTTGTTLKASYGTAFKAPSLFQLYAPFSGNVNLRPEKSRGYDIGFDQMLWGDMLTFGSTWFHNDISQLFGFGPPPFFPSINVGKARTQGTESIVTLRPSADVTLSATHTYTLAEDMQSGQNLLRRPKHQGNVSALWQYRLEGDVSATVRYIGKREDFDINFNRADAKAFTTLDIATNYRLNPTVTLYGRIDNLLDKRYEEVLGYGTSGMAVYAGVKTNF